MGLLFTVVESPRYMSAGTTCHGLYRSRPAAEKALEAIVREDLEDEELTAEEIEEYLTGDSIDTAHTTWSVGRVHVTVGDVKTGQLIYMIMDYMECQDRD